MIRLILFIFVFSAVVGVAAEKSKVELRFEIPERNVTGSQPKAWPKGVKERIMECLAHDAENLAGCIFGAGLSRSLTFDFSLSSDPKNAFDVLVSMPVSSEAEVGEKMKEMQFEFSLRYVKMAFNYDTTGVLPEKAGSHRVYGRPKQGG